MQANTFLSWNQDCARENSNTSEKIEEYWVKRVWVGVGAGVHTWRVSPCDSEARKLANFILAKNERAKSQLYRGNKLNNVY
jgi:hypothetical protein